MLQQLPMRSPALPQVSSMLQQLPQRSPALPQGAPVCGLPPIAVLPGSSRASRVAGSPSLAHQVDAGAHEECCLADVWAAIGLEGADGRKETAGRPGAQGLPASDEFDFLSGMGELGDMADLLGRYAEPLDPTEGPMKKPSSCHNLFDLFNLQPCE